MSLEHQIYFLHAADNERFMERLAASSMRRLPSHGTAVLLKDASLHSNAEYDIGIVKVDARCAHIDIIFRTRDLYFCLKTAIGEAPHRYLDETDSQVTLEDVFRIAKRP